MALETRAYGQTGDKATVIGLGGVFLNKHSFNDGVATVRHIARTTENIVVSGRLGSPRRR